MKTHFLSLRLFFILILTVISSNSTIHAQSQARLDSLDEDCIPPMLSADYAYDSVLCFNFDFDIPFNPIWLQYDDGVNVAGVGVADEFTMA